MKSLKILLILIAVACLLPVLSSAKDTDLYMASGEGVEPNILIIFDNSGSMGDDVPGPVYDPATTYAAAVVPLGDKDKVYYRQTSGSWSLFTNTIAEVACSTARTALTSYGHYEGNTSSSCGRNRQTLRTGNYRNYLSWVTSDPLYNTPKLRVAKNVVQNFLNTVQGVRLGVMVFNYSEGGRLHSGIRSLDFSTRTQLISDIEAIDAETWTPLAETLYEAGLFQHKRELHEPHSIPLSEKLYRPGDGRHVHTGS
jgi:type IV pilus assembly protein PilY1